MHVYGKDFILNTPTKKSFYNLNARKTPVIIVIFLLILFLGSIVYLLTAPHQETLFIADIYQNGKLLHSIPLYKVEECYCFDIIGDNNCRNTVQVRPEGISILSADCPDKICVKQGEIHNSLLPITCLPNRLVIQLRSIQPDTGTVRDSITPDIITH